MIGQIAALRAVVVISDDDALVARIRLGLARTDRLIQMRGGWEVPIPRASAGQPDIVVIDLRAFEAPAACRVVLALRQRVPDDRALVGVVTYAAAPRIAVVTSEKSRDIDFILSDATDGEDVGVIVRAVANDQSATACAAITLAALEGLLKPEAYAVAKVVLASGCAVRRVGSVAAELGLSSARLRAELLAEGSPPAALVIRHTQCAYALALARRVELTAGQLATFAKLGKRERFHLHCEALLGARAQQLADRMTDVNMYDFLVRTLARSL